MRDALKAAVTNIVKYGVYVDPLAVKFLFWKGDIILNWHTIY